LKVQEVILDAVVNIVGSKFGDRGFHQDLGHDVICKVVIFIEIRLLAYISSEPFHLFCVTFLQFKHQIQPLGYQRVLDGGSKKGGFNDWNLTTNIHIIGIVKRLEKV